MTGYLTCMRRDAPVAGYFCADSDIEFVALVRTYDGKTTLLSQIRDKVAQRCEKTDMIRKLAVKKETWKALAKPRGSLTKR